MHAFVAFFLGMVCAWAVRRGRDGGELGWWRPLAGGTAAAFPHTDGFFLLFGEGQTVYSHFQYGPTWSLLLVPIFGLGLAGLFGKLSGKPWQRFVAITLFAMVANIGMGMLTDVGVRPFYPLTDWRVAAHILYPFDITVFGISFVVLCLALAVRMWVRDIARVGLVVVLGYILAATTFHAKAADFAQRYIDALGLEAEKAYTMPQPISPFNWRIIVVTQDERLHDTMVNIYRTEAAVVREDSTRAFRIFALYKPMDEAVWRIYRRYGQFSESDERFFRGALEEAAAEEWFAWRSRFAVARGIHSLAGNPCASFQDIRYLGAKEEDKGLFSLCKENGAIVVHE